MSSEKYHKIFEEKKCCVLIPTYNNSSVLSDVIKNVFEFTSNIIIVNDGSTDNTNEILSEFSEVHIHSYKKNKGKGYALKSGLKLAEELGYNFAITMDSDGQHYAKDLLKFLELTNEKSIVIGARNMEGKDQKQGSSFANKFSNFWFRIETGIKHPDTQSGFRMYPLKFVNKKRYFTNKYEFEIEVIVRNAWRGAEINYVPIDVYYPDEEERISHFRPFKDFFRISVLNTVLVIFAFFYGLPARLFHNIKKKSFRRIIKEDILQAKDSNIKISKAVGFGFFMGILPVWGWQTVIAIAISHYLKLNKAIVVLAANISIPPMLPVILFGSFYTGALVLGNDLNLVHFTTDISLKSVSQDLLQYIVGSIVFAITAGLVTFGITWVLLKIFRKKKIAAN